MESFSNLHLANNGVSSHQKPIQIPSPTNPPSKIVICHFHRSRFFLTASSCSLFTSTIHQSQKFERISDELDKFDTAAKVKGIKEVRGFAELGLKEAKDLVEKAPVVVKKGVSKEEAESIIEKFKAFGATVLLE